MNRLRSFGLLAVSVLVGVGFAQVLTAAQARRPQEKPKLGYKDTPILPGAARRRLRRAVTGCSQRVITAGTSSSQKILAG